MLWTLLVGVAVKGLLLAAVALSVAWLLRRSSASARHLVLLLAVVSLGALPVWTLLSPLLPVLIHAPAVPVPGALFFITVTPGQGVDPRIWVAGLWLAVAAALLIKAVAAQWLVHRMCTRAHPDGEFFGVGVRISTEISMPFACGLRRTTILLPAAAASWSAERREVVLLHEFAHAVRRDTLARLVGQVAGAVHWFNPLAWLAVRQMAAEQEHACDDWVLRQGVRASDYANHLVAIARAVHGHPLWRPAALGMAGCSPLHVRLGAILSASLHRSPLTRWQAAAALCGAVLVAVPVVALRPQLTGALAGSVHDGFGFVPGAAVLVKGPQGTTQAKTDAAGGFRIAGLAPGRYEVRFRAPGFAEAAAPIVIQTGHEARLDRVLRLGEVSDRLDVVAPGTPAPKRAEPPRRIRVGGNVRTPQLTHMVRPSYPSQARQAGISGRVLFRAVIGITGKLQKLQLVDSPDPLLAQAATEAIAQWQYAPTHLNGLPVEVETMISVNFQLNP